MAEIASCASDERLHRLAEAGASRGVRARREFDPAPGVRPRAGPNSGPRYVFDSGTVPTARGGLTGFVSPRNAEATTRIVPIRASHT